MKPLVWEDDVEEVDVGDGNFISIASSLTVKDVARIGAADSQMEVSLTLLRQLVRSWRGPAFERNGEAIPCTPENVERLEISVASDLANRLASLVTGNRLDDEEKKESPSTS